MLMMTLILRSKTIFRGKEFCWRTLSRNMHEGIDLYIMVFLEVQGAGVCRKGSLLHSCVGILATLVVYRMIYGIRSERLIWFPN
jgi:hypothetical protein